MGSNAFQLSNEDLCCPVCKSPLSSPGSPPKQKINKQKVGRGKGFAPHQQSNIQANKNARIAVGKFKDNEDIVLARCGHLFHKFCLRHYCYLFREGRPNPTCRVTCPMCHEHISMMSAHYIDYKTHQGRITDTEKDFKKTELMHNELKDQKEAVKKKMQKVVKLIEDGYGNLQLYRSHRKKLKHDVRQAKSVRSNIDELYGEIEHADKMLAYMQTQHLKIVRKFIIQAKKKSPNEFLHLPRRLAPFLHLIEEDDRLVRNLGEIIVPIQVNHLKSDRRSLLVDIITIVNDKIAAEKKKATVIQKSANTIATREKSSDTCQSPPTPMPPVVVKVRRSSVSIMSSKSLTRDSIKKIMESVEDPIQVMKKAYKTSIKRKAKLEEKVSNNVVDNVSASDIKIIYMPKRKMLEQLSEPCRTLDGTESFVAVVPPRRCKSTEAILMKCRKKRQKCIKLVNKRSNSVTAISTSIKANPPNSVKLAPNHETNGKLRDTKVIVPSPGPKVTSKQLDKPFSIINTGTSNVRREKDQNMLTEIDYDSNYNIVADKYKVPFENAPMEDGDKSGPIVQQAFSVLKLIYDDLDEDRRFNEHAARPRPELDSLLITNRSELSNRHYTPRYGAPDSGNLRPRPQFFRVDGKGIARPESPYTATFHHPTFLTLPSYHNDNQTLSCEHPDEENQLEALSPEERLQISAEQESISAKRATFINGNERRQVYHGIPACMGVSTGKCNSQARSDQPKMPFYLKKWQEQLPSRKVVKTTPRRMANDVIRAARIPHLIKRDGEPMYSSRMTGKPKNESIYLPEKLDMPTHSAEARRKLPPLSMHPAKRPSTAECRALENLYLDRPFEPDAMSRIYHNFRI